MSNQKRINGKFSKSAKYVKCKCLYCDKPFTVKESLLKYGRGKYDCRKCCDDHKKIICVGEGNGRYGKKETEEHKKFRGQKIKEGTTKESIKKRKNAIKKYVKDHGYYPGTDEESKKKRKETFIRKYGVDHNWKVKEIRKKCEDTCIKLYGKHSWEIMMGSGIMGYDTFIEKIIQHILEKHNIEFNTRFKIPYNDTYKEYDIVIPSLKLLIEADGDYWHVNPKIYDNKKELYEIQITNIENDKIKTELAKKENLNLLRYWENDIKKENFENILLEDLKKYGYNKN